MRKVNKEIAKKIWEMHSKGYSYNKIALELNLSIPTIHNTIKKIKLLGEKYFEELEKRRESKKITRYFHTAKYLIKKLPKSIVKKILESYGKEA